MAIKMQCLPVKEVKFIYPACYTLNSSTPKFVCTVIWIDSCSTGDVRGLV